MSHLYRCDDDISWDNPRLRFIVLQSLLKNTKSPLHYCSGQETCLLSGSGPSVAVGSGLPVRIEQRSLQSSVRLEPPGHRESSRAMMTAGCWG